MKMLDFQKTPNDDLSLGYEVSSQRSSYGSKLPVNSKLQEIDFPSIVSNSPYSVKSFPPPTPYSTSVELETWINAHLETVESTSLPQEIKQKIGSEALTLLTRLLEDFKVELEEIINKSAKIHAPALFMEHFIRNEGSHEVNKQDTNIKAVWTVKLFYKVLLELIRNEEKQQEIRPEVKGPLTNILNNETFYRALLSCCLETVLFINNITVIDYEQVLDLCRVSAFDSWKLMKSFLEFDPKIPTALRTYFKSLELRTISYLVWAESSPVLSLIKQHFNTKEENTHPAIQMFCRRVLSHAALRISDLSNLLEIPEPLKEEIWNVMKDALSDNTELFINRHMDQVIICTIYGVCKAKNLNVTFNALIAKYTDCYNDPGKIFRNVRIDGLTNTGDIIKFYNNVYVAHMKASLLAISKNSEKIPQHPRVPSLNPPSSLVCNLPLPMISYCPSPNKQHTRSPSRSPFLTPRSRRYAFGESPSCVLDGINEMMKNTERLSYDEEELLGEPTKRPKHANEAFQDSEMEEALPYDFSES